MSEPNVYVVFLTAGNESEAESLATGLVSRHLAACVTIIPAVRSVYEWKGQIERASEWLLMVKTSADRFPALRDFVAEHHSYEVPELLALPVTDGLPAYLDWLHTSTR
jgi:periplasmic divalent cation tolerance protein